MLKPVKISPSSKSACDEMVDIQVSGHSGASRIYNIHEHILLEFRDSDCKKLACIIQIN